MALLTENGPCSVNSDGSGTVRNPNSWTETANVLWLDQPAGVGFSYGEETDSNENMVGEDAYYFLQAFFQTYPEYQSNPLYIVGESYGGHYVPAIAHRVWLGNKEKKEKTIPLKLTGIAIGKCTTVSLVYIAEYLLYFFTNKNAASFCSLEGNGLTDPEHQYPLYVEMVSNNSHGIKILDDGTVDAMREVVPKCVALIQKCNSGDGMVDSFACQAAFLLCNAGLTSPYQMTGLNPYDIRKTCDVPPLCYDFGPMKRFLNSKTTKQALHVDAEHSHSWETCNFGINAKFHTDWMKDFSGEIADLLNDGIPALIYAGDVDFICNYLGNRKFESSANKSN